MFQTQKMVDVLFQAKMKMIKVEVMKSGGSQKSLINGFRKWNLECWKEAKEHKLTSLQSDWKPMRKAVRDKQLTLQRVKVKQMEVKSGKQSEGEAVPSKKAIPQTTPSMGFSTCQLYS